MPAPRDQTALAVALHADPAGVADSARPAGAAGLGDSTRPAGPPEAAAPPEVARPGNDAAASAWDPACLAGRLVEIAAPRRGGGTPAQARPRRDGDRGQVPALWDIETSPRRGGSAALSAAASLLVQAQALGDPVAWVSARRSTFYPPDFEAGGIDLAALVVVRAADASSAARAADKLLRSGAFGLVVVDLDAHASIPPALASRLLGLARQHGAVVVFLTEKATDAPSIAPIVSLRVATSCRRLGAGRFACVVEAVKDKRHAPGWTHEEILRGPPGLR